MAVEVSCDASYLELDANPCPRPYTLSASGRCDLLIEDHIAEQGPSRWIFMGYAMTISLVCCVVQCRLLHEVYIHSKWQRIPGLAGLGGFVKCSGVRMRLAFVVTTFWLFLGAIDPEGFGGRLPFWLARLANELATTCLTSTVVLALQSWYEANLLRHSAKPSCFFLVLRCIFWVAIMVNGTAGPILETTLVPGDAPTGVWNTKVKAGIVCFNVFVMAISVAVLTAQYFKLLRALARQSRFMEGQRTHKVQSTSTMKSRTPPVSSLRSSSGLGSKKPSPANALRERRPQLPAQAAIIPQAKWKWATCQSRTGGARAPMQVHQFVVASWLCLSMAAYSAYEEGAVGFQGCWGWTPLPDAQWTERVTLLQLLSILVPTIHLSNRSYKKVLPESQLLGSAMVNSRASVGKKPAPAEDRRRTDGPGYTVRIEVVRKGQTPQMPTKALDAAMLAVGSASSRRFPTSFDTSDM